MSFQISHVTTNDEVWPVMSNYKQSIHEYYSCCFKSTLEHSINQALFFLFFSFFAFFALKIGHMPVPKINLAVLFFRSGSC